MKTIIAGSRHVTKCKLLYDLLDGWHKTMPITEVVCGTAKGIDTLGEQWADVHSIPVKKFPPDWSEGPKGGPERNKKMAEYADALIAICINKSKGTMDMIRKAKEKGLVVMEVHLNG